MALIYKIDVLGMLKQAGYNTNRIRKEKLFSESTLQKFRQGIMVSADNINMLCKLLHLQPGDIVGYVDDEIVTHNGTDSQAASEAEETYL